MSSPLAEAIVAVSADLSQLESQLHQLHEHIKLEAEKMGHALGHFMFKEVIGATMGYEQALLGMRGVLASYIRDHEQMEVVMRRVEMTAKQMGTTTLHSAQEAAEAMRYFAQLGFSAQETMQAVPNILNLASAGGLTLVASARQVAQVLNQFHMGVDQSERVTDTMAFVANRTATTIEKLGKGLSYAGTEAYLTKQSFDDVSIALGLLASAGQLGERAGTGLRTILVKLASADFRGKLQRWGIKDIIDTKGDLKPLDQMVDIINKRMSQITSSGQLAAFRDVLDMRGGTAMAALGSMGGQRIRDLKKELLEARGYAHELREILEMGLSGAFRQMKAAVETAFADFGKQFTIMPLLFHGAKNLATAFVNVGDSTKQMIVSFAEVITLTVTMGMILPRVIGLFYALAGAVMSPARAVAGLAGAALAPLGMMTSVAFGGLTGVIAMVQAPLLAVGAVAIRVVASLAVGAVVGGWFSSPCKGYWPVLSCSPRWPPSRSLGCGLRWPLFTARWPLSPLCGSPCGTPWQ
jgi:TP901 family phage tail tape measure protein